MSGVLGVVLAGGASTRMGARDKVLEPFGGETLLARAVARLRPQVDRVVVNGPARLAAHCDVEVIEDGVPGLAGPLAGLLAAMEIAREDFVVTAAVDTPFFPLDLAERLSSDGVTIARSDGQLHPVFARWPVAAAAAVGTFLAAGDRKIMLLARNLGYEPVDFPADPKLFFNVNDPTELAEAKRLLDEGA